MPCEGPGSFLQGWNFLEGEEKQGLASPVGFGTSCVPGSGTLGGPRRAAPQARSKNLGGEAASTIPSGPPWVLPPIPADPPLPKLELPITSGCHLPWDLCPQGCLWGGDTRGWGVQLEGAWVHAGIPKHRGDPAKGDMGLNPCWGRAHIFLGEGALRRSAVIFTGRGTASGQGCRRGAFFGEGGDGGIPAGGRAGGGDDTGGGRGSLGDSATWCRIGPARFSPN